MHEEFQVDYLFISLKIVRTNHLSVLHTSRELGSEVLQDCPNLVTKPKPMITIVPWSFLIYLRHGMLLNHIIFGGFKATQYPEPK